MLLNARAVTASESCRMQTQITCWKPGRAAAWKAEGVLHRCFEDGIILHQQSARRQQQHRLGCSGILATPQAAGSAHPCQSVLHSTSAAVHKLQQRGKSTVRLCSRMTCCMLPDKDDLPAHNDLPAQTCISKCKAYVLHKGAAVHLDVISTGTGQESSAGKADGSSSIKHLDGRLRPVCQLGPDLLHVCRGRGAQTMACQSHIRK